VKDKACWRLLIELQKPQFFRLFESNVEYKPWFVRQLQMSYV